MSDLKYISSLYSISDLPWERWCVSWSRRSFGRVPSPKKHQVSVDTSAPENPRCAMAGHYCGCHHGLLPALWAECCKCPSSGHGVSWSPPFFVCNTRLLLYPSATSVTFCFWLFLFSNDLVMPACGEVHEELYPLGFFKQKREGSLVMFWRNTWNGSTDQQKKSVQLLILILCFWSVKIWSDVPHICSCWVNLVSWHFCLD